ncbi:uncharacterized protein LOC110762455 [Prunus avium]|uniref:Uncharacterized protein LOC110762455 n=1 Tax=Prunus avium TaxID=42229 RepID=A0A6P5SWU7_PRUAV|nr:uncharacterized protein LOC110762455 [Prunus avium]
MDEEQKLESELQRILDMVGNSDLSGMPEFSNPSNSQDIVHGSEASIDKSDKMLSLTNKNFRSREDLIEAARKIAFVQGYALVIRRSKYEKYVVLGCDRGGNYKSRRVPLEERKKKSASRLINCPFEIWGKKKRKLQGFWKLEIKSLLHNHEPSTDMSGHPYCRRFSNEEIMRIKEMSMAGIPPRQILSSLRQSNPHLLAISRNIYNKKAKILEESLAGRTVIQALLDELGGGGFSYNIEYDQEGHLTHLFFAHPMSIELSKSYPHVEEPKNVTNQIVIRSLDMQRASFSLRLYGMI